MRPYAVKALGISLLMVLIVTIVGVFVDRTSAQGTSAQGTDAIAATATRLADGRWLVLGGRGNQPSAVAAIFDPTTQTSTSLRAGLLVARSGHSATLLPDGTVLVAGGIGTDGAALRSAELFDPVREVFAEAPLSLLVPRAFHTATVLTDGRILIAGGTSGNTAVSRPELWAVDAQSVAQSRSDSMPRLSHSARLLASGQVLLTGGTDPAGDPILTPEVFDPATGRVSPLRTEIIPEAGPSTVVSASPAMGATDVPVNSYVTLRLSPALQPSTVTAETVTLTGPDGDVPIGIISTEGGRLLFLRPSGLLPDSTYVVRIAGAVAANGLPVAMRPLSFRTAPASIATDADTEELWIPDTDNHSWRSNRPPSPWQRLPPLAAEPGVTALSGQVLTLDGRPLRRVTLAIGTMSTETDQTGRFVLSMPLAATGHYELLIDGRSANRGNKTYGVFEYGVDLTAAQTTPLSFTIWMPLLDTQHTVTIPSPTTSEVVVTTPYIPGLELRIPAGTTIWDHNRKPVTELSITPIPIDRPPFPLPDHFEVPVYFTIQPGGGYLYVRGAGQKYARLIYPNYHNDAPGVIANFWNYDPEGLGWHVYGPGKVAPDAKQVIPDPGVGIYEFTGAMFNTGNTPPADAPPPEGGPEAGDPVDLSTGLFVVRRTDLYLPDVLPIALTRTYRPNDSIVRPFGKGATHPYAMFLWSAQQWQEVDLILPDGARVHYVRTSPGTSWSDAIFEHTTSPTQFYKSKVVWVGGGWELRLRDGTVYSFPQYQPVSKIRDRHGNTVTITYTGSGSSLRPDKITSSNNRWITLTYDGSYRITEAKDNLGRTVGYTYDASGRLWKVTDPMGGVTEYTYDASHRMLTIKDAKGITYLTNQYDANGRVTLQTQADSTTFQFAYTLDGSGRVTQTDVTDPRGYVTRWNFNTSKYPTSRGDALGTAVERTTIWTRDSTTHRVTRVTDGLSRHTDFTYDSLGNVASVTRLATTGNAVTTNYTYESTFSQLSTVTDPLNHVTTLTRNSMGDVTTITDPLSHATTLTYNASGQPLTVTTPAGTTTFAYESGDLLSITDPLNRTSTRFYDSAGRLLRATSALGASNRYEYDALNSVTKVRDARGSDTTFTYDANSNLLTVTDARSNTTTYTYDNMDRVSTRIDPLTNQDAYIYDENGNLEEIIDRKGQVTEYTHDALNRQTQVLYHDSSTTDYTYDAGDRLTEIDDSIAGVIGRDYDLLDRLTEETTQEGTVTYTYDGADRRATMTVAGQTQISYGYDNADRLTSITQGSASVGFTYDTTNRRTVLTLPNGIAVESSYDAASQVTALTYKLGANTLGDLTYTYDLGGNRIAVGGSWGRATLPIALASATYNAGNQIATWGGTSFTYDDNGNLTSDGSKSYTWNPRNELTGLSGGVSASFQYDGLGRRRAKTISGTTTGFLYDDLNAVQELSSGSPSANVLAGLGLDEWYRRVDSTTTRDFLTDVLGSTVALGDGSGAVQTEYTYAPFGSTTVVGGSTTNRSGFTGREDDGTGLTYYRSRYTHPIFQRFISEDPIQFEGGSINLHSYVLNAPTQLIDPLGLAPINLPPYCNPRKHPIAWQLRCNPLVIGAGPVLGALAGAAEAGAAAGAGTEAGGSSASAAGAAEDIVTFGTRGHGARHLAGKGVSETAAEAAIVAAIRLIQMSSTIAGEFWGKVNVAGQTITYRAYVLAGRIHVGTYFPPK